MSAIESITRHLRPTLFLDYGVDAVDAETAACEVCERGMRFRSQWRFDLGAVLQIAFAFEDGASRRLEAEGLVVDCARAEAHIYQTTLAFLDLPQELRASLGKVSTRLEFSARRDGAAVPPERGANAER